MAIPFDQINERPNMPVPAGITRHHITSLNDTDDINSDMHSEDMLPYASLPDQEPEVVDHEQSSSIQSVPTKGRTLGTERSIPNIQQSCKQETKPVKYTEDAEEYRAIEAKDSHMSYTVEDSGNSGTRQSVLKKISHTEPFSVNVSNSPRVVTDQEEGPNEIGLDDTVERLDKLEILNTNTYLTETESCTQALSTDEEDRLHKVDQLVTDQGEWQRKVNLTNEPEEDCLYVMGRSFEEYVFRKNNSTPQLIDKNINPLNSSSNSPPVTSCSCSRCEYSTSVGYTVSPGQPKKSTHLFTKLDKCPPQRPQPPPHLTKLYSIIFLFGWMCCWLGLKKTEKMDEGRCKEVSTKLQYQKDKPMNWKADRRQKECNVPKECQLVNGEFPVGEDDYGSSDFNNFLRFWIFVTSLLSTNKPSVDQSHSTRSTLNPNSTKLSDQSLHKKKKLTLRKSTLGKKHAGQHHCKRHTVKPALSKGLLHCLKSRPSRRLAKRMNSLEKFQDKYGKTSKQGARKLDYLYEMPDVKSQVNVFMVPFNHPNSQSAVNNTEHGNTGALLGATAGRLTNLETFNEHISVFEQMSSGTVTESMKYEWARFKSFWSFPMSCPILPTILAKYGFYYTGNEDKVCCFCCGVTHGDWQKGQSVYAMHYQISRRCRFMRGEDVGNVPIHSPISALDHRGGGAESLRTAEELELTSMLETPDSITSILLGRERDPGNLITTTSHVEALPTAPNVRTETRNGLGVERSSSRSTSQTSSSRSSSVSQATSSGAVSSPSQTPVSSVSPTPAVTQPGHVSVGEQVRVRHESVGEQARHVPVGEQTRHVPVGEQTATVPQTSTVSRTATTNNPTQTTSQAHPDTLANQERPANQQHPTTLAQRQQQRHQDQQQGRGQQQHPVTGNGAANIPANLGVTTAKPRYPNYAVLTIRSSTYNGFPNHLDQTPLQMARAGFFYAGYGDYVRCFFCGGGLRNWEPGDDPWVEHARWFPRCAYVKQNRGQTFINLVLQRQRELTLPNEYINTTTGASSTTQTATIQTARTTENQTTPPPVVSSGPNTAATANPPRQAGPAATQRHTHTPPSVTDDEMKSPAVLNIKEMGYSDEIIKTAIQRLRRDRGPIQISAELLVEIIFGLGDDLPPQGPDQTQIGPSHVPATQTGPSSVPATQTGPSNVPATQTETRSTTPPRDETPPSNNKTPGPQAGAAPPQLDPRPPRRLKDGDSSTRSYTEEELKSIQEENDQLKEQMKCKICMDNVVCISFLPCGHLCCCAECAPAMVKCPICRQVIRGSVKTYLS